jgi:hypothetical protein
MGAKPTGPLRDRRAAWSEMQQQPGQTARQTYLEPTVLMAANSRGVTDEEAMAELAPQSNRPTTRGGIGLLHQG